MTPPFSLSSSVESLLWAYEQKRIDQARSWLENIAPDYEFSRHQNEEVSFLTVLRWLDRQIKEPALRAKLAGLRGLYRRRYLEGTTDEIIADLVKAHYWFPHSAKFCEQLAALAIEKCEWQTAHSYLLKHWQTATEQPCQDSCRYLYQDVVAHLSTDALKICTEQIISWFKSAGHTQRTILTQSALPSLFAHLYHQGQLPLITELMKLFKDHDTLPCDILLYGALTYHRLENTEEAKSLYLLYDRQVRGGPTLAVILSRLALKEQAYEDAEFWMAEAVRRAPNERVYQKMLDELRQTRQETIKQVILHIRTQLTDERLSKIGYNAVLFDGMRQLGDRSLQQLFERDTKEIALALLVGNYKSVILMSGSLCEALLLQWLRQTGRTTYSLKNREIKPLDKMDFNDLLYVAKKERVLSDQLYHLAHVLRDFRNLIHPGVEQRTYAPEVSQQNAYLAWAIVRKMLLNRTKQESPMQDGTFSARRGNE